MRSPRFFKCQMGLVLLALSASSAAQPVSASAGWALQVTPYLWAARLDGAVSPFRRTPSIHVDKSFREIFDSLNVGGFLDIYARRGNYVLAADLAYTDLSEIHTSGPLPCSMGRMR